MVDNDSLGRSALCRDAMDSECEEDTLAFTLQTKTSFGVPLLAKHELLSRSGRGLSASLLFKTCG